MAIILGATILGVGILAGLDVLGMTLVLYFVLSGVLVTAKEEQIANANYEVRSVFVLSVACSKMLEYFTVLSFEVQISTIK